MIVSMKNTLLTLKESYLSMRTPFRWFYFLNDVPVPRACRDSTHWIAYQTKPSDSIFPHRHWPSFSDLMQHQRQTNTTASTVWLLRRFAVCQRRNKESWPLIANLKHILEANYKGYPAFMALSDEFLSILICRFQCFSDCHHSLIVLIPDWENQYQLMDSQRFTRHVYQHHWWTRKYLFIRKTDSRIALLNHAYGTNKSPSIS